MDLLMEFLWNQHWPYFAGTVRLFLLTGVAAYFIHLLCRWRKYASEMNKMPSMKLQFYHILGHAHYVLQVRRMRTNIPRHVYDFMLLNALSFALKSESVFNIWVGFEASPHIHKAEAVEAILNNSRHLEKAWFYKFLDPWLKKGFLTSHGTKWRSRRKLLTPTFHFNILQDFLPVINNQGRILVELLNNHTSDEFVDIMPLISRCSFDIVCESILGAEMRTQTETSNPYAESVDFLTRTFTERAFNPLLWFDLFFIISPLGREFYRHLKVAHEFPNKLISERKEKLLSCSETSTVERKDKDGGATRKRKAFLDLLLDEHINNNSLSEDDIMEEVNTFTFGGHDTTSTAMSFCLYLIGLHPGIQGKIHKELDSIFGDDERDPTIDDLKEMKYLDLVIKESLRLYPPAAFFGRIIDEDIHLGNYVLPKGCTAVICAYFLHRDPDVFPNPEKFDPERFSAEQSAGRNNFAYIPFSAGPRNCIGQRFALMEAKAIIASVLKKFKIRSLDPRDRVHLMMQMVLKPAEPLRLEIRPRDYQPEKPPTYFYYP